MNSKKKTRILAAILMACLVLAGCGSAEPETKDGGDTSKIESQGSDEKTNSSESSTDSAKQDALPESGTSEANYEPVTIDCSEILNSGDTRYFELIYQYGDACTIRLRYLYENEIYNGGSIKIEPGTETDLEAIINNVSVLEGGSPSLFTEVIDGWTMNYEASEEESAYMNSYSIEDMRVLSWGMSLMAAGYSQEEAEAIVGESGGLEPPFISDEPSDFTQSGVTLEDVSYMLFGADGTTIFFSADYAGEFTIEEKFLFDSNGDFESLEIMLTTGSVSDTDEIFATLKSLYGDGFEPDDYTLSEQSEGKYIMRDSVPTRSFFLGSDLAGVDGVTYSVVYSVLSDAL
ncbi:MAG: hypothetical protein K2I22_03590 [Lachnospiraceae bacterium]|nr:hypothetical protein [Lachnospiraceae bacterium]